MDSHGSCLWHLPFTAWCTAAEHVCLKEHTQPVSAVSDPWICHVGEPEAEAAKDGCWREVSEGTYFWIPFVSRLQ